jgi:hypothetical protein
MGERTLQSSYAAPRARGGANQLGRFGIALVFVFSVLLPIMRFGEMFGSRVNFCFADALLLPVFLLLGRRWIRSGALGAWLLALWAANLIAWALNVSILEPMTFARESLKVVTCSCYALVGFGLGRETQTERAFARGLIFSIVPISLLAISAFFTGQPSDFVFESRVTGSFTDPNAFAVYEAMLVPVAATLAHSAPILGILVGGTIAPLSRTGMVSLLVAMTLTVLHSGWRRYIWFLIFAAVAVVVLASGFSSNAAAKRVSAYEGTLSERHDLWSLAGKVGGEHPLFGIGRGNWEEVSGSRVIPHNTFLSFFSDIGGIGLAVFLIPVLTWLSRGFRHRETRGWAITCLVGMVGGLAVSFDNFRFFWLAIGVLVAQLAVQEQARRARTQAWEPETVAGARP